MRTFPSDNTLTDLIESTEITFPGSRHGAFILPDRVKLRARTWCPCLRRADTFLLRPSLIMRSSFLAMLRFMARCLVSRSVCGVRKAIELGILCIPSSEPPFAAHLYTSSYGVRPVMQCFLFLQLLEIALMTPGMSYHHPIVRLSSPYSVRFNLSTAILPCGWNRLYV